MPPIKYLLGLYIVLVKKGTKYRVATTMSVEQSF